MAAVMALPAAAADDALADAALAEALLALAEAEALLALAEADALALAALLDELDEQPASARPAPAAATALPAMNVRRDKFFFIVPPVSLPWIIQKPDGHTYGACAQITPII